MKEYNDQISKMLKDNLDAEQFEDYQEAFEPLEEKLIENAIEGAMSPSGSDDGDGNSLPTSTRPPPPEPGMQVVEVQYPNRSQWITGDASVPAPARRSHRSQAMGPRVKKGKQITVKTADGKKSLKIEAPHEVRPGEKFHIAVPDATVEGARPALSPSRGGRALFAQALGGEVDAAGVQEECKALEVEVEPVRADDHHRRVSGSSYRKFRGFLESVGFDDKKLPMRKDPQLGTWISEDEDSPAPSGSPPKRIYKV